jgi:predicted transcriptional regulator
VIPPELLGRTLMRHTDWNWIEYRTKKENYLKEYRREKMSAILEIIIIYGMRGGISNDQLSKEAYLDPKNLRPYIKELIKEGLAKKDKGLRGKYFPTEEAYKDQLLNAYLFGNNFRRNILTKDIIITTDRKVEYTIPFPSHCIDFTIYRRYFEPKFDESSELERSLFEFSNKIGGFITYFLIQIMDANSTKLTSNRSTDYLVEEMFRKAVLTIIPYAMSVFKDSVYKSISKYHITYEDKIKYLEKKPRYIFEKDITKELRQSFVHIYPLMSYEFEKIDERLSNELASFKEHLKYMHKRWKEQEVCKHDYNLPVMTIHGYCGKQCNKCHCIARVKDSVCTILSEFEKLLNDGYKIEKIRPSEFNTAAKINSLEVILISYQGEKKSIKGVGEEAHTLRQFIRSSQNSSIAYQVK